MTRFRYNTSGFTLIELLVGMVVFAIGLTGIYALLNTTLFSAGYSRDEVVVAGLLREQIELVENIRDTNLKNYIPWDSVRVESTTQTGFAPGVYTIENSFETGGLEFNPANDGTIAKSPIMLKRIDPATTPFDTIDKKFESTRLYLDAQGRYTHLPTATGSAFASYMTVSPLIVDSNEVKKETKNQGWIIDARVIVKGRGYTEYDAKTMITDWIR